MQLAKPAFDVGLFTNRLAPMLAFWQRQVGLELEYMQPIGGGVRQHRHRLPGSAILKLNHAREPLPGVPPAGYCELLVARPERSTPLTLIDPDGNRVTLVPPGQGGVGLFGLRLHVADPDAHGAFYRTALGLEEVSGNPRAWRCGEGMLLLAGTEGTRARAPLEAPGYRYLTLQVFDCDAAYDAVIAAGGDGARAPRTRGTVARIAFVRDPDGNWIELSQRASLTGPLPA